MTKQSKTDKNNRIYLVIFVVVLLVGVGLSLRQIGQGIKAPFSHFKPYYGEEEASGTYDAGYDMQNLAGNKLL